MTQPEDTAALLDKARDSLEAMANRCKVDMQTWDRHANNVLRLIGALQAATQRRTAVREDVAKADIAVLIDAVGRYLEIGPLKAVRNDLRRGYDQAVAAFAADADALALLQPDEWRQDITDLAMMLRRLCRIIKSESSNSRFERQGSPFRDDEKPLTTPEEAR